MNRKVVIIALVILVLGWFFFFRSSTPAAITSQPTAQTSPTPAPLPKIVVDDSTDLQKLNQSLTPRDFAPDYQELKNQAKQI